MISPCTRGAFLPGLRTRRKTATSSLGNSGLDRLANASYQITVEGQSYWERLSPHRALLGAGREGGD